MEEAAAAVTPFQLQFDKTIPFQIKMAEWNPEKDLLAMVTDDSKVLLHRFNWQRLWTISPGKHITSICWSPDGKIVALGTEDGLVLLHDVENGKMLRSIKSHDVAIVCLNWAEDGPLSRTDKDDLLLYEDRTPRFFPPAPVMPRIGGLNSADTGLADENEEAIQEFSSASCQRFNILCSGDKDGCICFSIFGIFPVGKILVGWPPVRTFRKNLSTPKPADVDELSKVKPSREEDHHHGTGAARDERSTMYVKVNLEGYAVGRKIDLKAHRGYDALRRALQSMFHFHGFMSDGHGRIAARQDDDEQPEKGKVGPKRYILLYEDNEGDRMLVGDVPWELFVASVKRLYIAQA